MDRQLHLTTVARPDVRGRVWRPISAWRRRRELREARGEADAELLLSASTTPRTAWRSAELTAPKNRVGLARAVQRLLRSADARYLPGATPLNRIAVREHADTLRALAERLSALESPVGARGVLLLDRLLKDGYGPFYVSYPRRRAPRRARPCASGHGGRTLMFDLAALAIGLASLAFCFAVVFLLDRV